ncbi:MAG: hypothetical protein HYT80_04115, partial [Euryarchaeota archaeon]|nr:hypothetical protein [Euryarchaeota archaeon]
LHSITIHKVGESGTKKDNNIEKGSSTNFKFEQTGTFHVYCKYHCTGCATGTYSTGMVQTVTVA